nr:glycosyltransferase [uncultured Roseateles sp.]
MLCTFGTGGDLYPFLRLAQGLRQRGRRTLLLVPRFHEARVRESGLAYLAFGTHEQSQAVLDEPDLWHERKGFGVVWRGLLPSAQVVHDLVDALPRNLPCTVLSHPLMVPLAALARGSRPDLRIVGAYLAPAGLRTVHDPLMMGSLPVPRWVPLSWRSALWRAIDRFWMDPDLLPGLNAARTVRGLAPVTSFLPHMQAACDASVGLFPAWYAARQPDWPPTFVEGHFPLPPAPAGGSLSPELETFLASGAPPIAFTPGTGHRHAARYFADALPVLRALGRRGLFITPYADQVPQPLPPEVLWQASAPFEILLPRLAMLVHHGGIGTTAEALRAGTPQLIVPYAFDQFDNGMRVQRLGAGAVLPAARANARRMGRLIAQQLAQTDRQGPPAGSPRSSLDPGLDRLLDSVEQALGFTAPSDTTRSPPSLP